MTDSDASPPPLSHRPEDIPAPLLAETLEIRCMIAETLPALCAGWETTVENEPTAMRLDDRELIYFPDAVPTTCAECNNRSLAYNNYEITFRR